MVRKTFYILCCLVGLSLNAQQEFHVFPIDDTQSPGTSLGNGSLALPWDLQTALSQKIDVVKPGDTIWIHEGVYNGRFVSTIHSKAQNKYITVSGYKTDKVVLNGNISSKRKSVLEVNGQRVIYKNFIVSFIGDYSRNEADETFQNVDGINHNKGVDCQFIDLKIHNNPGSGFGSWKRTGGTKIIDCVIYNNGYITKKSKGGGVGIYVQNSSESMRIIENNIIFNNFYKGVQVWSANKNAKEEFVKNVLLKNNAIFNNGSPSGYFKDNLIIASGDRNAINIAKNIKVFNNVFYHNTNVVEAQINGDAASLTLGFNKNAPIEDVEVKNNIIIGRNNALRILHAKSLTFQNNIAYCGYVHLESSIIEHTNTWDFKNNTYFTKKTSSFRIIKDKDYNLGKWQSKYGLDRNSKWKNLKQFDLEPIVKLTAYKHRDHTFKAVVLEKNGKIVLTNFSSFGLKPGRSYKIYDVENLNVVLKSGTLPEDGRILLPMDNLNFEKPLHNSKAQKTLSNFGVFIVAFDDDVPSEISTEKKDTAFKRFFKWLGF